MKERHISRDKMQWLEMDILDLQFEDGSFDLVIDKGKQDHTPVRADVQEQWSKLETFELELILTNSALLTTKGDPWVRLLFHRLNVLTSQNPPEKDIKTCTREITEALRVLRKRKGSKFV